MGRSTNREIPNILKESNTITLHSFMASHLHLTGNELIIFAAIYSYCSDGTSCFFGSNGYLASWCQIHEGAVGYHLRKLVDKNLIQKGSVVRDGNTYRAYRVNMVYVDKLVADSKANDENSRQEFGRQKFDDEPLKICGSGVKNLTEQPQIFDTYIEEDSGRERKEDREEIPYEEIIGYLNERTGKHFHHTTKDYRRGIHARWVDDGKPDISEFVKKCKYVIDVKCAEWLGKSKFENNLNPKTLFRAANFDRYANQSMPTEDNVQSERMQKLSEYEEPAVGSKRYDNTTGITEVYRGNGIWEKASECIGDEEDDDIEF